MERKMYFLALTITVAALILFNVSLYSSMKEDRIESFIKQSYMFKTYLKSEDLKNQLKDGVVSTGGKVDERSDKRIESGSKTGLLAKDRATALRDETASAVQKDLTAD